MTLTDLETSLNNGMIVHVFVKNMDDFAKVNSVYKTFLTVNPPARQVTVCKEFVLPSVVLLFYVLLVLPPNKATFY